MGVADYFHRVISSSSTFLKAVKMKKLPLADCIYLIYSARRNSLQPNKLNFYSKKKWEELLS